jgi:hypothetical protein
MARLLADHDHGAGLASRGVTMRRSFRIESRSRSKEDVEREIAFISSCLPESSRPAE